MPPASRPLCSWSVPSVGETVCSSCATKVSGRAPNLRTLASSCADFWVKLPVIWASESIRELMVGALCTTPSSTTATCLPMVFFVSSVNLSWPGPLKETSTW